MVFKKSILFFAVIISSNDCFAGEVSDAISTLNIHILKTYLDNRKITQAQKEKYLTIIDGIIEAQKKDLANGKISGIDMTAIVTGSVSSILGSIGSISFPVAALSLFEDGRYDMSKVFLLCSMLSWSSAISGLFALASGLENTHAKKILADAISIKKYIARYPVSEVDAQPESQSIQ